MRALIGLLLMFASLSAFASEPDIVLTHKNSYNGYAFVAGKVTSKEKLPIGITVEIGGAKFSTVSDPTGNWALTFRHLAVNFSVTAWRFDAPFERVAELTESIAFAQTVQKRP